MTDARKGKPVRKKKAIKSKVKAVAAKFRPRKAKPKPKAKAPAASVARQSGRFIRMLGLLGFLVVIGIGVVLMNWPFWAEVLAPYWYGGEAETAKTPAAVVPAAIPSQAPMTVEKDGESIEEMRTERQRLRQELNRLMARMETIEKSVNLVKKLIQATAPIAENGTPGKTSATLAERLSKLEDSSQSIKSLLQRMDKLELDSAPKIGAEPNTRAGGGQSGRAQAIVLAVANLRQAVAMDEPFEKPLEALSALYGDDPDIKSTILVLSKSSVAGIPTLATLRERFDGLAGKIVQASKTLEETGWIERATNRIMSLVTWRRVGNGAEASSLDAIVARAEARLKVGDSKGAIDALKGLSTHAKAAQVAAPWLKDAKARVVAERAVATLHVHAVSLLARDKE